MLPIEKCFASHFASLILDDQRLSTWYLKKTDSVCQMLSVRRSKLQNHIVPGLRCRLVLLERIAGRVVKSDDCT